MRTILQIEELAQLLFGAVILYYLKGPVATPWLLLLFFVPDVFAIGFLMNNRTGTYLYNLSHHKALAIVLIGIGMLLQKPAITEMGVLWYCHIAFDRSLGYGLKYFGNPNHTHLGYIGRDKAKNKEAAT